MTERDERRARLAHDSARAAHSKQVMVCVDSADLRDELETSEHDRTLANRLLADLDASIGDRTALAEARELLGNIPDSVVQIKHLSPRWHRAIAAFLKRTEPADE